MWTTPKVNWHSMDFYNIEDWLRLRSNLEHLRSWMLSNKMYAPELLETDTGKGCDELPFVHLVNNMEKNLKALREAFGTDLAGDVSQKTWYERLDALYTANPNYQDWNRWEYITLCIYESIQYIDTYIFTPISGSGRCGSERTLIRFSRGR